MEKDRKEFWQDCIIIGLFFLTAVALLGFVIREDYKQTVYLIEHCQKAPINHHESYKK